VASFVGESNIIDGNIIGIDGDYASLKTACGSFLCRNPQHMETGETATIFIRPETVFLAEEPTAENVLACRTKTISFEGAYAVVTLTTEQDQLFTMRLNNDGTVPRIEEGENIKVRFSRDNAFLLKNGGTSIA
jgi:ABC-type Fe3+/spermidine/putrescine transport system ATPase subunit